MITRPLALLERLRPPPRNFDTLFFVNAVLLGLFFALFGSRFVVSPGVELENPDFRLPVAAGAVAGAQPTRLVIDIPRPGVAYTPEGQQNYRRLGEWLKREAARQPGGRVLIRADAGTVPARDLVEVYELVRSAGFQPQLAAESPGLSPASVGP